MKNICKQLVKNKKDRSTLFRRLGTGYSFRKSFFVLQSFDLFLYLF